MRDIWIFKMTHSSTLSNVSCEGFKDALASLGIVVAVAVVVEGGVRQWIQPPPKE